MRDAWSDLEWYFGSALGVAAQAYGGSPSGVFDDLAVHQAHMRKRTHEHRRDVSRHTRIAQRLATLSAHPRETLALGFAPWGSEARAGFGFRAATVRRGVCLAGIVVRSAETMRAFCVAHDTDVAVPEAMILRWVESISRTPQGTGTLKRLADAAERELSEAVELYRGPDINDVSALRAAWGLV